MSVARCAEINARLRAAGVVVHEMPGWQSRGNGMSSAYEGGLIHHTATPFGMALPGTNAGRLLVDGRTNLSGPLCNYAGNEDGSITVIAAHPANHAGASGGRSMGPLPVTTLFNKRVLGLEIVYPGTSPMRDVQFHAAVTWARAVAGVFGRGEVQRIRAHAETSVTGKWDPGDAPGRTIDMTAFRNAVASGQENDLTPDEHNWLKFVHDRVAGILPQRYFVPDGADPSGQAVREVGPDAPGATPAHVLDTLDGNFLARHLFPLADDAAKILAAISGLREDHGKVRPDQVRQLAEELAARLPRDLEDEFTTELHAAFERAGQK
ncbi:N-acetylmuramoyl-L-alanine amidase [Actinophytocola sp.]|uniref:peptidoglycan recognition protein family protein n=1 Tax=Actinophytocola sp. TaxID=1872138 RepID=UPI002D2520DA|nr:N-acetylmuramoyl-L-alanine amidase [Actinophytocola sp.]HYQ69239.1 N-acetylmuramoyl-L-alanine amidase [Actinophytocola sp.]